MKEDKRKPAPFNSLTPCDDVSLEIYDDAFNYVFDDYNNIRNVAISGSYGSGKSSVLNSWINRNKPKKADKSARKDKRNDHSFLFISLAHFHNAEKQHTPQSTTTDINTIEGKIINQLIHQIPVKDIPKSKFRVVSSEKRRWRTIGVVFFVVFSLLLLYAGILHYNSELIEDFYLKKSLVFVSSPTFLSICIFFWIVLFIVFLYSIVNALTTRRVISKINFKGNEIELFSESKSSYFDKYLNDVLYLFENVSHDVIVFEDIDRFEDVQIFERLREINKLANDKRGQKKKTLRFFYLLRDDIFTSKDRTKFFDFIIPIIPVIDSSNSYDKMHEILEKMGLLGYLDRTFLKGLSLYIDDMRLLKNICNEFYVYDARLQETGTELNLNKLLAIIAYKNIFPADFNALQLNRGYLFALFSHKIEFVANELGKIESRIGEINLKLKEKEEYSILTKERLNIITNYYSRMHFSASHNWSDRDLPHFELLNSLDKKQLETERTDLQEKQRKLSMMPLMNVINDENADAIFRYSFKDNLGIIIDYSSIISSEYYGLLRFLIRNGYIDESYPDYITYFYQTELTSGDKSFITNVHEGITKGSDYSLSNPALVFEYLQPIDFEKPQVLNYDLIDFLITAENNEGCLFYFVKQLKESSSLSFLEDYYNNTIHKYEFIIALCSKWASVFERIQMDRNLSYAFVHDFAVSCFQVLNESVLESIDENQALSSYVKSDTKFLRVLNPDVDRMIAGFKKLSICFLNINFNECNYDLILAIYENGLFELKIDMIEFFCKRVLLGDDEAIEPVVGKTTSIIVGHPESVLYFKIEDSPESYIDAILEKANNGFFDNEKAVAYILNSPIIKLEKKKKYIQNMKTSVTQIQGITSKECWRDLIENRCVEADGHNVVQYIKAFGGFDDVIIGFINETQGPIQIENDDWTDKLWADIIACKEISDYQYKSILDSPGDKRMIPSLKNASDEIMSESKVRILIDLNLIEMNVANLSFVRENYGVLLLPFIILQFEQFLDLFKSNPDTISSEELESLLISDGISVDEKIRLVEISNYTINTISLAIPVQVKIAILENCPNEEEFHHYYSCYSSLCDELKPVIAQIAKKQLMIFELEESIPLDLLEDVLSLEKTRKGKLTILSNSIEYLDSGSFEILSYANGLPEYSEIFTNNKRLSFKKTAEDRQLLEKIRKKRWISRINENPSRNRISITRGKTSFK